ncbi:MAG: hypothetical protein J4A00_06165 [Gammaproteobacteria bacterium]|nr:hypothetical protein [Gammaproteobacteria bacterium]
MSSIPIQAKTPMPSQFSDDINRIVQLLNDFDQSKANPRGVMATDSVLQKIRLACPDDAAVKQTAIAIKAGITSLYMPSAELDRTEAKERLRQLCGELQRLTS